jgi:hypothetical protein
VFHLRPRLLVFHSIHHLETLDEVAGAERLVGHVHRRMTMHARTRLLDDILPLCEGLIVEHKCVAALFPEIFRKGIPRPHRTQARVFFEP